MHTTRTRCHCTMEREILVHETDQRRRGTYLMTLEEVAMSKLFDDPIFDTIIKIIVRETTKYCYGETVLGQTFGAGTGIQIMVREQVLETLKKLDKTQEKEIMLRARPEFELYICRNCAYQSFTNIRGMV